MKFPKEFPVIVKTESPTHKHYLDLYYHQGDLVNLINGLEWQCHIKGLPR